MDDDEEWRLYQLLIDAGKNDSDSETEAENATPEGQEVEDQIEEFHQVDGPDLRVSYSTLPPLSDHAPESESWFQQDQVCDSYIRQATVVPFPPEMQFTEAKSVLMHDSQISEPFIIDRALFHVGGGEPFEFILLPPEVVHPCESARSPSHCKIEHPSLRESSGEQFLGQIPDDVVTDPSMLWAMLRYVELARGAYADSEASLQERTNLDHSQIYHYDFCESRGRFPRPAFYLAVDETLQALVLSIRGTTTALELQIDAKWTPIEFPQMPGAFVHQGIYLAARWFIDNVLGRLLKLADLFPDYKVRVVGHSLGGGIAALFTLMIKDVLPRARAVIFAPPACISAPLVPHCREVCVSFVNQTDVLPLLTHANITSFFSRKRRVVNMIEEILHDPSIMGRSVPEMESEAHDATAPRGGLTAAMELALIQLYPPGDLHHIFQSLGGSFHLRNVPHDYFLHRGFQLSRTMVHHHQLLSYMEAFEHMLSIKSC